MQKFLHGCNLEKILQYWTGRKNAEAPFFFFISTILHQNRKGYICVNIGQNVIQKIAHLY